MVSVNEDSSRNDKADDSATPETPETQKGAREPATESGNATNLQPPTCWQKCRKWISRTKATEVVMVVLTAGIVYATFSYTHYASLQWKTMDRQLRDSEALQSAKLVIEDFNPTITVKDDTALITGTLKITNAGQSVATQLYINRGSFGVNRSFVPKGIVMEPDWLSKLKPIPLSSGPSIVAGHTLDYPITESEVSWTEVQSGKWVDGFTIAVSYRDIFERPQIVAACFQYYPDQRILGFRRCPVKVEQVGDVTK